MLGNGNNVLVTASGGGTFTLGNGNNTVYYGSGVVSITAGSGVNTFWLSATGGVRHLDCGGNPASIVYVNQDTIQGNSLERLVRQRTVGCARFALFDGAPRITASIAAPWSRFDLVGGPAATSSSAATAAAASPAARATTSSGPTSTRSRPAGESREHDDHHGRQRQQPHLRWPRHQLHPRRQRRQHGARRQPPQPHLARRRLQPRAAARHEVTQLRHLPRARTRQPRVVRRIARQRPGPRIRCLDGAVAVVVYGNTKPKTNCRPLVAIRSKRGEALQLEFALGVPPADPVVDGQIQPGQNGIGVPRPGPAANESQPAGSGVPAAG